MDFPLEHIQITHKEKDHAHTRQTENARDGFGDDIYVCICYQNLSKQLQEVCYYENLDKCSYKSNDIYVSLLE